MKKCAKCHETKEFSEFPQAKRGLGGVGAYCKKCMSEYSKQWHKDHPYQRKTTPRKPRAKKPKTSPVTKVCRKCRENKLASDFYKDSRLSDGLSSYCISCYSIIRLANIRKKQPKTHYTARELGYKTCRKCQEQKPVSEFAEHMVRGKHHGFKSWCKECTRKQAGSVRTAEEIRREAKRKRDEKELRKLQKKERRIESARLREKAIQERADRKREIQLQKERIKLCQLCGNPREKGQYKFCKHCSNPLIRYKNDKEYREKVLKESKRYQKAHRPQIAKKERERRKNNPTLARQKEKNREARERGAIGSHTAQEWESMLAACDYKCVFCGKSHFDEPLTEDHIIPITLGGTNYISNIQPACRSCNSSKGNRSTTDLRPVK